MERRFFLTNALLVLAGAGLPATRTSARVPDGTTAALEALFRDANAAAAVGRKYLCQQPQEASAAWLARTLFDSELPVDAGFILGEHGRRRIRIGRERDFHAGDLVIVDGWFFARTEARLLALVSTLAV